MKSNQIFAVFVLAFATFCAQAQETITHFMQYVNPFICTIAECYRKLEKQGFKIQNKSIINPI